MAMEEALIAETISHFRVQSRVRDKREENARPFGLGFDQGKIRSGFGLGLIWVIWTLLGLFFCF